jgi:hypothetical protein
MTRSASTRFEAWNTGCERRSNNLKPDITFVPGNRDKIKAGAYKCVGE